MDRSECKQHVFMKKWVNHYYEILSTIYPEYKKKDIKNFLYDLAGERVVNREVKLDNNYNHRFIRMNLLDIPDWIDKTKPIVAGHGVFFRNQDQVINPPAHLLLSSLNKRSGYKKKMATFPENTYEYDMYDRFQGAEKVIANSFYGGQGAPSGDYYNLYTASSVTSTAQSLISTAKETFEAFVADNVQFYDLDDCLNFCILIMDEKYTISEDFLPIVFPEMVYSRVARMFHEWKDSYEEPLRQFIYSCPRDILKRFYYKSNLYEFAMIPDIHNRIEEILEKVDDFQDPNDIPQNISEDIDYLWDHFHQFVFTNQFYFGRIKRLKAFKRKTVVTIDTDSNMLHLDPWVKFCFREFVDVNDKVREKDDETLEKITINIMCVMVTRVIKASLYAYTTNSNIPERFKPRINMKNEFWNSRMVLTAKKKRYASAIKRREAKVFANPKIDVKGADFMKSSTRAETEAYFTDLLKNEILLSEDINFSRILRKVADFENIIRASLARGEKSFLIPKNVKEPEAYDDPYKLQGFRAVLLWNAVYPDSPIQLPDKIDMVKLDLVDDDKLEELKGKYPDVYKAIYDKVLMSTNKKYAEKKAGVIALPSNITAIPEWILEFTDYDTIVDDNISKFNSFIDSIGGNKIKTGSNTEHFSNIIQI